MELIKIIEREGRQLVSGRELHEFLEIRTKYKDWFRRMVEYGFEEEIDFIRVAQKRATNNLSQSYGYQSQKKLTAQGRNKLAFQIWKAFIVNKLASQIWEAVSEYQIKL